MISCLTFWTGCSILPELVAPAANFAMGLYNADTYYSKECAWYKPVKFQDDSKLWLKDSNPPEGVVDGLRQVAKNNDMFKEVCDE